MRTLSSCILASLVWTAAVVKGAEPTERFEKIAESIVQAINRHDYAAARGDFSRSMLEALSEERTNRLFDGLLSELGRIRKLGQARLSPPNQAVMPVYFERGIMDLKLVLDGDDKIIGLWFLPHVADIPVLERNTTPLSLPFRGRWILTWGGDTKELNYHHDVPNQRFAFDLLGVGDDGKTRKGDGKKNEDYFAFGREVLAPADGLVTDVITGVRDNVPGSMNSYSALGNAVFIQHSEYEVSVIAHLRLGSERVSRGQKVKRGEVIGLCGNSGNSSEPHIHYHLMNTPIIQDATGIKVFFDNVEVGKNGGIQRKKEHSPIKGEVVRPL